MPRKPQPTSSPLYSGPLPRCEGPKLDEFHLGRASIDFRALLSDSESDGQAHVFEVRIGSRNYALKVFKFYNDQEDLAGLLEFQKAMVPLDMLHAHADPFYNECRAYGKLEEKNLNGKVAVRCHGYTILAPKMESVLERKFNVRDWDRLDEDKPISERASFRAIVKDLIRDDPPFTPRMVRKMLKDLTQIRKQEIYPSDIRRRNYKGGLLVDFSNAITLPNYLFNVQSDWDVERYKNQDLFQFDKMVEDERVNTPLRVLPKTETLKKLRRRTSIQEKYGWSTPSFRRLS